MFIDNNKINTIPSVSAQTVSHINDNDNDNDNEKCFIGP